MGDLYDYNYHKTKKLLQERFRHKGLVYEVYRSAVEFIHHNLEEKYDDPLDHLTTHVQLRELFKGDEQKLAATLNDLVQYWKIERSEERIQVGFEVLETIGDLCEYIEKRVKC
ncbi:hypothetical protein [Halobacillus yeomjeoni]|uniref:Uncharacterized protein n=1 Tax=Halobacillus yeomjeoni TaxID=311194 RepID=A0A931HT66_9BACI|nr:hypothetical protein [Halobacillus yeomjeoni]MBH0228904.1 hypothetical protein [Halobacillus yeomjeoni]